MLVLRGATLLLHIGHIDLEFYGDFIHGFERPLERH